MQYFTEQGDSHSEALEMVRSKYGEAAQVLSHRTVRRGGFMGLFAREGVEVTGYIRPDRGQAQKGPAEARPRQQDFEEEKRKLLSMASQGAQARADQALQQVLAEIQGIKEKLDDASLGAARAASEAEDHETIRRIDALLALNDFSEGFRREAVARLRRDFSLDALDEVEEVESAALEWIGDSIKLWRGPERPGSRPAGAGGLMPRVLALVGPTGVGKTTTIAKLAAIHAVGIGGGKPQSVRMITIDNYRIGARQQIETYGGIMGVPVSCVETAEDLRKTVAMHSDADLILVDTVGKSPRDAVRLAEMQRVLAACGPQAEVHLALSATTKASDMVQIMRQFEPFDYKAVVITKLDETNRIGNAISALAERGKTISFVTNGQSVPQNIERARVTRLLMNLEGFRVDRPRLEARYGEPTAESEGGIRRDEGAHAARPGLRASHELGGDRDPVVVDNNSEDRS